MFELNRKIQPNFKVIEEINIPVPEIKKLDNGIKTHLFNIGTQDVLKIDVIFNAGSWHQNKPLISTVVNEMLIEGTKNYTSHEIAEKLDFYGAFIQPEPTKDFSSVTLYTLNKYLPETIKILEDIIKNPIFPDKELTTFLNKRKQQFLIELEKVTNIARREFNEQLFGENHPYGKKVNVNDYDSVTNEDLILFHENYYHPGNCKIIVSGKINENVFHLINTHLGNNDWKQKELIVEKKYLVPEVSKPFSFIKKENVTQSAIRIGKLTINKDHPDFHKLKVAVTILGGFFGSRLMKKIREEKGYTYGISSILVSMKHAGYLVILSEVGKDVAKLAIDEVINELKILKTELVSDDELSLVKNYMLGDLMRAFDGAFEISSAYRSLIDFDLDHNYLLDAIKTIKSITSEEIKSIVNKYLDDESLVKTIAGKYD